MDDVTEELLVDMDALRAKIFETIEGESASVTIAAMCEIIKDLTIWAARGRRADQDKMMARLQEYFDPENWETMQ